MGEFDRIEQIIARIQPRTSAAPVIVGPVIVGPGDDAAVLSIPGNLVMTTDIAVEGVHFRQDWSSAEAIGAKVAAANGADCAAMGARPIAYVVSLATPKELDEKWSLALADGLRSEAERAGASIVGGDLSSSDQIVISIAAVGALDESEPVLRSGARTGDRVVLAGSLGRSAAGLALLKAGRSDIGEELIRIFRTPDVPYALGPALADAGATSMIDISDGLLADLGHIAKASGVGISIFSEQCELSPLLTAGAELGIDPMQWFLTGGEDHALVATLPATSELPEGVVMIGEVVNGSGVVVPGIDTSTWAAGFDHFRITP